ncbi:uncharacterized protein LOC128651914 [Bombina bombina]|uniref:uncharacterized protein LOC128651914 n=1 Tax=Bombina bombina TaxID=8345 RepID=UPI00235A5AE0|nr:uncharacterized protein LOC128651914 [Bombina bombina]
MEDNAVINVTSVSSNTLIDGDWNEYPTKDKALNLKYEMYPEFPEKDNLQEGFRMRKAKKEESLITSKYRIGGSVESIFSQTSVHHPEWTILRSSKSQDALTHNSNRTQHEEWTDNQPLHFENPDVVDDVVGDEVIFKSPGQKSHNYKILDYRPNQPVAAHDSYFPSLQITELEYSPEYCYENKKLNAMEIKTYFPCVNVTEKKMATSSYFPFDVKKDKEEPGLELVSQWAKNTDSDRSSRSEERDCSQSQDAESDGSQNISMSLLKSILMEREDKINNLSKDLRRLQAENLFLLEEKQCLLSENETIRKEFEVMTFDKVKIKQDLLNASELSSPMVLQRQIANLKNQINNLHEANESAVLELAKAEEEISQHKKDIARLKAEYNHKLQDSQEEIKLLKERNSKMPVRFAQPDYVQGLHKEIFQLRNECRRLRDQSHQLNEENHQLKEELWDYKRQNESEIMRTTYQKNDKNDEFTTSCWNNSFREITHSKSWHLAEQSLYRNDAFKDEGTLSKCKAALGSLNIKEPWEPERNTSPVSVESENTDMLIMGHHEETPCKPFQENISGAGGTYEEIQGLSDDKFYSISQRNDMVICNTPHESPKATYLKASPSRTTIGTRSHGPRLGQQRRPFAPKNVADLKVGHLVKFSRPGGKISNGTIQYKGHLNGREEVYLGVELDGSEVGKHDGIFQGTRYFHCKTNKGVFVNFNKVIMAWE